MKIIDEHLLNEVQIKAKHASGERISGRGFM